MKCNDFSDTDMTLTTSYHKYINRFWRKLIRIFGEWRRNCLEGRRDFSVSIKVLALALQWETGGRGDIGSSCHLPAGRHHSMTNSSSSCLYLRSVLKCRSKVTRPLLQTQNFLWSAVLDGRRTLVVYLSSRIFLIGTDFPRKVSSQILFRLWVLSFKNPVTVSSLKTVWFQQKISKMTSFYCFQSGIRLFQTVSSLDTVTDF